MAQQRVWAGRSRQGTRAAWLALAVSASTGCSGSTDGSDDPDATGSGAGTGGSPGSSGAGAGSGTGAMGTGPSGPAGPSSGSGTTPPGGGCFASPPAGAELPPAPPPYSGGSCPTLVAGPNALGGRALLLAVPANLAPNEKLPVAFLWHWLGGDANDFYERGDVQTAVDHYRFLAVIPESKGDVKFKWPIESFQSQGRINEELTFFDDMLSCVAEQYNVELGCVGSVGVSAGALFTSAVLAGGRGQYLSSILSLSGGVGGFIKDWKASAHKMPALVLWGGPNDNCFGLMNFVQTSHNLENALGQDGHFFLECIHNCGHAAPPFEIPGAPTAFAPLWDFILDHPYWLDGGASPYEQGIPPTMPEWCGVGAGSAEPRTGECTEKSGC